MQLFVLLQNMYCSKLQHSACDHLQISQKRLFQFRNVRTIPKLSILAVYFDDGNQTEQATGKNSMLKAKSS